MNRAYSDNWHLCLTDDVFRDASEQHPERRGQTGVREHDHDDHGDADYMHHSLARLDGSGWSVFTAERRWTETVVSPL